MKLATHKYFTVVVTVLCLANILLFSVSGKQAHKTLFPVDSSSKLKRVDEANHTSPIALATYLQPVQEGEAPSPIPSHAVVPATFLGGPTTSTPAPTANERVSISPPTTDATFRAIESGRFVTSRKNITFSATIPTVTLIPGTALAPGKLTWFRDSEVTATLPATLGSVSSPFSIAFELRENHINTINDTSR